MTQLPGSPPLRVEQALRLLPDLEALAPLRAVLVAAARPDDHAQWRSSGPYLTVGKRGLQPGDLRREIPAAIKRVAEHLSTLYECFAEALECQQRRDGSGVVAALLKAGRVEEAIGRLVQARPWYEVALTVGEGLQDRAPEIETLRLLGRLGFRQGRYGVAARAYQRSLVLAEAQFDPDGAVVACQGLGDAALAQGEWQGAKAWYARGLRLAEGAGNAARIGQMEHHLSLLALRQGAHATAEQHLGRARDRFEQLADPLEMARVLNTQGQLDAGLSRRNRAAGAYMEALAWAQRGEPDPGLEISIRLNLAELHLLEERFLDAEAEMRRTEELAIAQNLIARLIHIYSLMGRLRGLQGDETGFVFFEQGIELCRTLDRSPLLEAQVYYEYGVFRSRLGQREEARAYLERAREAFESLGGRVELERVQKELERISA